MRGWLRRLFAPPLLPMEARLAYLKSLPPSPPPKPCVVKVTSYREWLKFYDRRAS